MNILVGMDFIVDKFKLLGLNDREVKVFTALATFGRMNMTKIASRSQLPRTTVDAIVRRLIKQGLVTEEKIRGHVEYVMNPEDIANKLDWVEKRLRPKEYLHKGEIHKNDENDVTKKDCFELISQKIREHKGERVKIIFSHEYGDSKLNLKRFLRYIHFSIESKLKLEILLSTHMADVVRDGVNETLLPEDPNMIRLNVVPASYGSTTNDLIIFRDVLLLVDPDKYTVEQVQHSHIVEMSKHLLGIASEVGWSINITAWMKG